MSTAVAKEDEALIVRPCPEIHVHIFLDKKPYAFRCGPPGSRTFLLTGPSNAKGEPYRVYIADQDGWENDSCTCPDFTHRLVICKHIRALRSGFLTKIADTIP